MSQQALLAVSNPDLASPTNEGPQGLGDRLQKRIHKTVVPLLAQGFLEDRQQRLAPGEEPTEEDLAHLFEATLALLHRLLFLLYAEGRGLLPTRDADYFAFSLRKMQEEIAAEGTVYSDAQTALYERLMRLFEIIDKGDPALNVPAYQGRLFSTLPRADAQPPDGFDRFDRVARFLGEHKVGDRCLALAIDALARDGANRVATRAFIDYASLDVGRLGSVYEGLLDCALQLAKGRVSLASDGGKRKATGSYYTPAAIVEYLVANTVGPVFDAKLEAARRVFRKAAKTFDKELEKSQARPSAEVRKGALDHRQWAAIETRNQHRELFECAENVFDLRVLDPAMGCGHFLVEAVDFIAGRLLDFLQEFPNSPVHFVLDRMRQGFVQALAEQGRTADPDALCDRRLLKRHVVKRCIYGVDLDPMAVELAKAGLWLKTCVPGAPSPFLDHHLRCGNALVGSTLDDLRRHLGSAHRLADDPPRSALRRISSINRKLDVSTADVRQAADEHAQARRDLSGYEVLLDLMVAKHFGLPAALDVLMSWRTPHWDLSSRESFLHSLEAGGGRPMAERAVEVGRRRDLRFFHWELEFQEAYATFVDPGERQLRPRNDWIPGSAGFDCVVGNPPYVRIQSLDEALVRYLGQRFEAAGGKFDLYIPFLEQGTALLRKDGLLGMIVPNKFLTANYGAAFRAFAARNGLLRELVDFEAERVFPRTGTYCCLVFLGHRASDKITVSRGCLKRPIARETAILPAERFGAGPWSVRAGAPTAPANGRPLKTVCRAIFQGLITGADRLLIGTRDGNSVRFGADSVEFDPEIFRPVLKGPDVRRFALQFSHHYVLYPYRIVDGRTELMPEGEIAARHPGAYRYLCEHRRALERRGSASMVYPAWYAHWCPRTIDRFSSPKIVTQVLAARASFALDRHGTYWFVGGGNAGVYGVVPDVADNDRMCLLLAMLNSRGFDAQVQARSSRFQGGYFSYARRFIGDALLPRLDGLDMTSGPAARLIALVRQRVEEGSEPSASQDAEIDALVDDLSEGSRGNGANGANGDLSTSA